MNASAHALLRGLPRIAMLVIIGFALLQFQLHFPLVLGPVGTPMFLGLAIAFFGIAAGEVAVRIAQPRVDAQRSAIHARETGSVASALVYVGRNILIAFVLLIVALKSTSAAELQPPPANALKTLPIVKQEQLAYWPGMPMPSVFGSQIHRESCVRETSPVCWTTHAQLKTSREQGLSLGQFTRAWDKSGNLRMDALAEMKRDYPKELAGLSWDNPYDTRLGARFVVLKDKQIFDRMPNTASILDHLKMMAAAYNGGEGGLRSDRTVCRGTPGCDYRKWDGNVAETSLKAKVAVPGYGQPFFVINRQYAHFLVDLQPLRARYVPYLES
jgi:hypothetical protein